MEKKVWPAEHKVKACIHWATGRRACALGIVDSWLRLHRTIRLHEIYRSFLVIVKPYSESEYSSAFRML